MPAISCDKDLFVSSTLNSISQFIQIHEYIEINNHHEQRKQENKNYETVSIVMRASF